MRSDEVLFEDMGRSCRATTGLAELRDKEEEKGRLASLVRIALRAALLLRTCQAENLPFMGSQR